jgi:hypothetical protein
MCIWFVCVCMCICVCFCVFLSVSVYVLYPCFSMYFSAHVCVCVCVCLCLCLCMCVFYLCVLWCICEGVEIFLPMLTNITAIRRKRRRSTLCTPSPHCKYFSHGTANNATHAVYAPSPHCTSPRYSIAHRCTAHGCSLRGNVLSLLSRPWNPSQEPVTAPHSIDIEGSNQRKCSVKQHLVSGEKSCVPTAFETYNKNMLQQPIALI